MDIVLAVAVDAEIPGASQRSAVDVATLAVETIVGTLEREVAYIVQRLNVAEIVCRVAGLAHRAVGTFMNIWLRVASEAVLWPRLESDLGMTIRTLCLEVNTVELPVGLKVVVEDVLTGLHMA